MSEFSRSRFCCACAHFTHRARDVGFNGDPTYHIKCIETNAFTTVVRSPAVSRFTRDIADIIGLDTVPEFHFRFSDYPIGAVQPAIRWTVYNPHDQLTLIAKLIYIAKADRESTTMQAMVMDGHVVTATCTKNMATGCCMFVVCCCLCCVY